MLKQELAPKSSRVKINKNVSVKYRLLWCSGYHVSLTH